MYKLMFISIIGLLLLSGCYQMKPDVSIVINKDDTVRYRIYYGPNNYTEINHVKVGEYLKANGISIVVREINREEKK